MCQNSQIHSVTFCQRYTKKYCDFTADSALLSVAFYHSTAIVSNGTSEFFHLIIVWKHGASKHVYFARNTYVMAEDFFHYINSPSHLLSWYCAFESFFIVLFSRNSTFSAGRYNMQGEVQLINRELQNSGQKLQAKAEALIKYRKTQKNIELAVETLSLCLPGITSELIVASTDM